jgi:hypothetical protein
MELVFRKCNALLETHLSILNVMVLLQLLVTAFFYINVMKPLLFILKSS